MSPQDSPSAALSYCIRDRLRHFLDRPFQRSTEASILVFDSRMPIHVSRETPNSLSWDQFLFDHSRVKPRPGKEVEYEEKTRGPVRWDVEYA